MRDGRSWINTLTLSWQACPCNWFCCALGIHELCDFFHSMGFLAVSGFFIPFLCLIYPSLLLFYVLHWVFVLLMRYCKNGGGGIWRIAGGSIYLAWDGAVFYCGIVVIADVETEAWSFYLFCCCI